MAFTKTKIAPVSVSSPESLFRDLRTRTVEGLLAHQADILRRYQADAMERPNVAIELPTGSGKTLVGLLIAEFRRVTRNERTLYLCPTRQLVRQVVEASEKKYGIKAIPFVGRVRHFDPNDKARYQTGQAIAVATYSALFNTNPFFNNPNLIVLDDAHAAENYIAANWSVMIPREDKDLKDIYLGLLTILKPVFAPAVFDRFLSDDRETFDVGWVEKLPTPVFDKVIQQVAAFLDVQVAGNKLQYPWSLIHQHLHACHLYVSHSAILIRPCIPPTNAHAPFASAKQRVFMSATLGRGGDLERITGVRELHRLPIPEGWDKQGIGRRFFVFPELSVKSEEVDPLVMEMARSARRSLILVPSDRDAEEYGKLVTDTLKFPICSADDIERSKTVFTDKPEAVALLAGRYDGIDLIGDECRLLIIKGLPKSGNLQESFLMVRMGAATLLQDRIRTRIIQAIGRCTRSATDYAAVVVIGDDFHDWLVAQEKRALFHPELQGELRFGAEQSMGKTGADFLDNLRVFLRHGDEWSAVDADILGYRNEAIQVPVPGEDNLLAAAKKEVDFQYALWSQDYERCVELAQEVAGILSGDPVKGYRGFWNYLGASAALRQSRIAKSGIYGRKASSLFAQAAACAPSINWLRSVAGEPLPQAGAIRDADELLSANAEAIELLFDRRGYASDRRFEKDAKAITDGLATADADSFEEAQRRLGEMLGFQAGNSNTNAAPDPWWISSGQAGIVFEDKTDSKPENPVAVRHARQAASHPQWIAENVQLEKNAKVLPVMVTVARAIDPEAAIFGKGVGYWYIDDFRKWATEALNVLRQLRAQFSGPGNLVWRSAVSDLLRQAHLDPRSIFATATARSLDALPQQKDSDPEVA